MPGPGVERPEDGRKRRLGLWFAAIAALVLCVLAFLWFLGVDDIPGVGPLAMPGQGSESKLSIRAQRMKRIFGSREGILIPGSPDFNAFLPVAEALLGGPCTDAEAERLARELMKIEAFKRLWEEYRRAQGDPRALAELLRSHPDFARLLAGLQSDPLGRKVLAKLLAQNPVKDRVAVKKSPLDAAPEEPATPPPPRDAQSRTSASNFQVLSHVFSMMPRAKRDRVFEDMEKGFGIWDACRTSGLIRDCVDAVKSCKADAGCGNWLKAAQESGSDLAQALATAFSRQNQRNLPKPPTGTRTGSGTGTDTGSGTGTGTGSSGPGGPGPGGDDGPGDPGPPPPPPPDPVDEPSPCTNYPAGYPQCGEWCHPSGKCASWNGCWILEDGNC